MRLSIFFLMFVATMVNAQTTVEEALTSGELPALSTTPIISAVSSTSGGVSVFTDAAVFGTAAPLISSFEDFSDNNTGGALIACDGPFNSTTDNACFTPGQITEGLELTAETVDLIVVPAGFGGLANVVIGANSFTDTTFMSFPDADVLAVAMDISGFMAVGDVDFAFTNAAGGEIGTATIAAVATIPGSTFVGFIADEPIADISITADGGDAELITNVSFGLALPPASPVPTLQVAGLFLLVLILGMASLLVLRRRNAAE